MQLNQTCLRIVLHNQEAMEWHIIVSSALTVLLIGKFSPRCGTNQIFKPHFPTIYETEIHNTWTNVDIILLQNLPVSTISIRVTGIPPHTHGLKYFVQLLISQYLFLYSNMLQDHVGQAICWSYIHWKVFYTTLYPHSGNLDL